MNIQVLQMVVPSMSHKGRKSIAIYFPRVRVFLNDFLTSHKERVLKKTILKVGGSTNRRGTFSEDHLHRHQYYITEWDNKRVGRVHSSLPGAIRLAREN